MLRGSQAPRRAVCGTRGSLRTMHGGGSAPSCWAFPHRVAFGQTLSLPRVHVVLCIQRCSETTKELGIRSPGIHCLWGGPNYLGNGRLRVTFPREKRYGNSNPPEAQTHRKRFSQCSGVGPIRWGRVHVEGAGEMTGGSESRRASRIMVLFPTRMCLPSGRESGSPTPATANTTLNAQLHRSGA